MATEEILIAAELLRRDKLVAFPTETVYGLGANATSSPAIKKIFLLKGRPTNNPLIVHVDRLEKVDAYVELVPNSRLSQQFKLISHLWPGPLTVVFPQKKEILSDMVTAGLPSVGIRIPDHAVAQELLREVNFPLAAPSANKSEYVSATEADHVRSCFGPDLYVLDGGKTPLGLESTIIRLTEDGAPELLRYGFISKEQISEALSDGVLDYVPLTEPKKPSSPGQFKRHYSPATPLRFVKDQSELIEQANTCQGTVGFIAFSLPTETLQPNIVNRILSESGDQEECAQNLYSTLRELDKSQLDLIFIERPEEGPLYKALLDRLERAVC